MLTEVEGDLFDLGLPAIGHGCNCSGVMGAGIAAEFRRRWPQMYQQYREMCLRHELTLGDLFVYESDVAIYNLMTQPTSGPTANLGAIGKSVKAALQDCDEFGIPKLGLPRIGCGIGGLRWEDVRQVLDEAAEDSPVDLVLVTLP